VLRPLMASADVRLSNAARRATNRGSSSAREMRRGSAQHITWPERRGPRAVAEHYYEASAHQARRARPSSYAKPRTEVLSERGHSSPGSVPGPANGCTGTGGPRSARASDCGQEETTRAGRLAASRAPPLSARNLAARPRSWEPHDAARDPLELEEATARLPPRLAQGHRSHACAATARPGWSLSKAFSRPGLERLFRPRTWR